MGPELVKPHCVSESMATGSGRFGKLLVQLGAVLKPKQQTNNPSFFEMIKDVVSNKGMLQMVNNGTKELKLPMANKRAIWREWEVAGVQPTCGPFSGL